MAKMIPIVQMIESDTQHKRYPHDPVYDDGVAFISGEYLPLEQASLSFSDATGFSQTVYDAVSVYRGYIFRFDDHLDRLERSCETLKFKNPYSREKTRNILIEMVKLTGLRDAFIWFCVNQVMSKNRGKTSHSRYDISILENKFYATVTPYQSISTDEQRLSGMDILISKQCRRIPLASVDPQAKNMNALDMRVALKEAFEENYEWCVLLDVDGNLTEAPGANIFVIKNGVVSTPDSGCLEGITAKTVTEICRELGVPVKHGKVAAEELLTADEAFLASTGGGVMPINSVDRNVLGGVQGGGDLSLKIHNLYWEKRGQGWLGTHIEYD